MTAVLEIVTDAIVESGAVISLHTTGLSEFNAMLGVWVSAGAGLPGADLTLLDTFPLSVEFEAGAVYTLAARLSPAYVAPGDFDPDAFLASILQEYPPSPTEHPAPPRRLRGSM